jgi:acetone carboxylase gamma subunit
MKLSEMKTDGELLVEDLGRDPFFLELAYETSWKEYYCPHCGWLPENEADLPGSMEEF